MSERPRRVKALLLADELSARRRTPGAKAPDRVESSGDWPFFSEWVDCLAEAGIIEARFSTHTLTDAVRGYIEQVNTGGRIRLVEAHKSTGLNPAATIAANVDLADDIDEVVVIQTRTFSEIGLDSLIAFHRLHGDPLTMVLSRDPPTHGSGKAELDEEGRIVSYRKGAGSTVNDLAGAGIYVIGAAAYRDIAAIKAFDLESQVIPLFLGRMRAWIWEGDHLDTESHETLDRVDREAAGLVAKQSGTGCLAARRAVFLDRDGTLMANVPYLSDPKLVRLLPGAAETLRRLNRAGFARILVTNQSAIGRGILTEERLNQIHAELIRQLAAQGATIDAIYYCPSVPRGDDRTVIEDPDRKPGPGMLLRAAADLNLDLNASWMVGDSISDVLAGRHAGCQSILVLSGETTGAEADQYRHQILITLDIRTALDVILDTKEG